jgi:HlyD family secretion protein
MNRTVLRGFSTNRLLGSGLLACIAFLPGCRGSNASATPADGQPTKIVVSKVKQENVRRTVDVVGTLAAYEQVTISSEGEGKVLRILADLGDRVTAGQPLVELDREKSEYRLAQQQAAVERAMAKYGVSNPEADLPAIERTPDVQKAAAELAQAEQNFARANDLFKTNLVPKQQLDDADAALKTKKAAYESSLQGARNLRADIAAERASLLLAQRELRDGVIRAPFDAYVERRLVSPGQFVRVQTPIAALVKIDPLKVTAEVPERVAPWIKVGQRFSLTLEAFPDKPQQGTVARISPAANPQTRAFPFEGNVPNGDGKLKPGTFARVHIETDRVEPILTVPANSLQYRYGVNRVFVVSGDRLQSKEIKIGDRIGERVEVLDGVQAEEPIVAADVDKLTDGTKIVVGGTGTN